MSFFKSLGEAIDLPPKLSYFTKLLANTRWLKDRTNGDNIELTGAGGHDHTGSGDGVVIPYDGISDSIDFSSEVSEAESTTSSGSYINKVTHTFTPPVQGDYIVFYQFEISHSISVGETNVQVDVDAGTIVAFSHEEPTDANDYGLHGGCYVQTFTAAAHTVEIDFLRATGSGLAKIRRARVMTWRVA